MRFLIAPNAFKGCLSPRQAAGLIGCGVLGVLPSSRLDPMPISDGGDGLIEVLLERHGGRRVTRWVTGPLGGKIRAAYALLADGRTAVVEMAQASGLAGIPRGLLDPLRATSYGTGELIRDALGRGRKRILVGMGGSASSDGGAGMAAALGVKFLDSSGRPLPLGAQPLRCLSRVDLDGLKRWRGATEVVALSDVTNPLLGPRGSARVYGPQKGASPSDVRVLEEALGRYAKVLERDLDLKVSRIPGSGAAGGLGAGLAAFLRARITPGAEWVLDDLDADARIAEADCVVTGEGKTDASSFFGKAPWALAQRARRAAVPVLLVCGQVEPEVRLRLSRGGIQAAVSLMRPQESPAFAMRQTRSRMASAAGALVKAWLACALLASFVFARAPSSSAASSAEIDRLYFHRDQPGNLERSKALLEERLKQYPRDSEALWRLGRSLVRLGESRRTKAEKLADFTRAEELLGRSVEISSAVAEAHFWYGLALGRRGETRGILRSLFMIGPLKKRMHRVLELDPRHGGAHHVLGEMLLELPAFAGGSKTGAVLELEEAVRLTPNDTAHYPALAQAYLAVGDQEKAKAALRKAFEVKHPDDPAEYAENLEEAARMLKKLGSSP